MFSADLSGRDLLYRSDQPGRDVLGEGETYGYQHGWEGFKTCPYPDGNQACLLYTSIQAFPDKRTLVKYKAILEWEICNDLDMELDIAGNLSCYEYDAVILSAADYGEYILEEAGIHTKDPAFSGFDLDVYKRQALCRIC